MRLSPRMRKMTGQRVLELILILDARKGRARAHHRPAGQLATANVREKRVRQQSSPGVQEVLAVAVRHHQAGRPNDAERLYRQILQADAHHADALHLLGVLAQQAGRIDVAVDLIEQAIAQNGRVPAFHNNLGNALKAQGEQAVTCYGRALTHKPYYVEAHYNLGIALQAQGKLDQALDSYRRATYRPGHAEAHSNLGKCLQAQGKLQEAVACYRQALTHMPGYSGR